MFSELYRNNKIVTFNSNTKLLHPLIYALHQCIYILTKLRNHLKVIDLNVDSTYSLSVYIDLSR